MSGTEHATVLTREALEAAFEAIRTQEMRPHRCVEHDRFHLSANEPPGLAALDTDPALRVHDGTQP